MDAGLPGRNQWEIGMVEVLVVVAALGMPFLVFVMWDQIEKN
jgi:hypothetical protein